MSAEPEAFELITEAARDPSMNPLMLRSPKAATREQLEHLVRAYRDARATWEQKR